MRRFISMKEEKIQNYAYQGFYITQTPKGFVIQTSKLGRATLHVAPTLIMAKAWIEENCSTEDDHMRQFLKQIR